jgi:hypothetical protein
LCSTYYAEEVFVLWSSVPLPGLFNSGKISNEIGKILNLFKFFFLFCRYNFVIRKAFSKSFVRWYLIGINTLSQKQGRYPGVQYMGASHLDGKFPSNSIKWCIIFKHYRDCPT